VRTEVREASDHAEGAPIADPEEGFAGVYAGV
jgi:hypothetical protein